RDAALHLPGRRGERQSFDVTTDSLTLLDSDGNARARLPLRTGVRVSLYTRELFDENEEAAAAPALYRYGQRLRVAVRLRRPRNSGATRARSSSAPASTTCSSSRGCTSASWRASSSGRYESCAPATCWRHW